MSSNAKMGRYVLDGAAAAHSAQIKAAEKLSVAADSLVNCTQATTTAGERSAPLMLPTCVQMQMHVRTDKTTAVSRTARRTEVFGHARDSR